MIDGHLRGLRVHVEIRRRGLDPLGLRTRLRNQAIDNDSNDREHGYDADQQLEPMACLMCNRVAAIDVLFELEAFGRNLVYPRENCGDREPQQQQDEHERYCPLRHWKDVGKEICSLQQDPARDDVEHHHSEYIAPLEFGD